MGWNNILILFIVSLVLCAVGFYKYVYFMSVGYGLAVAGCGVTIFVLSLIKGWAGSLSWMAALFMLLFVAYGIRLSGFLIVRELKNASYRKVLAEATKTDEKKLPFFVLFTMWVLCAVLYVAQTSAVYFRFYNKSEDIILPVIAIAISVLGLVIEAVSDQQKSAQKKENPDMVATKGLFKISRCPNYCGEIIFWTGIFVSGITSYNSVGQWITAVLAYICIIIVMVNGAQRLEKRQNKRYGNLEEYRAYVKKTPILMPFIPIYHLNKTEGEK